MPLVAKDRVQETTTTTGTGTLTLGGAVTGYQTFSSAIGNGNTCYYAIDGGSQWEVGLGTVGAGTLARNTVLESSNSGSLVNLSAGTKNVFVTYPAERGITQDENLTATAPQLGATNGIVVNANSVSASYTIPTNYNAMSAGSVSVASGVTVQIPSGSRWVIL